MQNISYTDGNISCAHVSRLLDDSQMMKMCVYTGFCALGHVDAHKHHVFIYDSYILMFDCYITSGLLFVWPTLCVRVSLSMCVCVRC